MEIDTDRIDEAVLALLYLGLHGDDHRTWKGFDWESLNRLYEKGYIANPINRSKSMQFSEEGLKESERLFHALFGVSETSSK